MICDWTMPDVSGYDVLTAIRKTAPDLPFIMVTGRTDQASVASARDAGVSAWLAKPFTRNQFEAKLRIVTRRRAAGMAQSA